MAKENWATVKDLADWFNKLVSEGKGDYFVEVDDNFGGNYGLDKGDRYGYYIISITKQQRRKQKRKQNEENHHRNSHGRCNRICI